MDPPSPTKFPMSPPMPLFPVSPERVAGIKPPYGGSAPSSPSLPDLRTSPLRKMHRRNDSDVSVHGLAAMFENLEVKDFKEAQTKYLNALNKQKVKYMHEIEEMEKKHMEAIKRYRLSHDEIKGELKRQQDLCENHVDRDIWDKQRQEHREALVKWEAHSRGLEERKKQIEAHAHKVAQAAKDFQLKNREYKKKNQELSKDNLRISGSIPTLQAKIQSLERHAKHTESDLKYQTGEADKYKNQVYGLQVDLESVEARLTEELQTMKDKLRLVEGERDALKTSLKEEEVMRIAAEGQIPLPTATTEEHDDFGSPVRSPRKQRSPERDEEDKENVAPKRGLVELKFLQQELSSEKRLRERAQDQIEFMKMECQFRCCSCRIADLKGSEYVHDNAHDAEMRQIKASVPEITPPPSDHGDDPMEDVVIKQEASEDSLRALTPPAEIPLPEELLGPADEVDDPMQALIFPAEENFEVAPLPQPLNSSLKLLEPEVAFSPTTGTFKAVASPTKAPTPAPVATPTKASTMGLSATTETATASSPWTPDANNTVIHHEPVSPSHFQAEPEVEVEDEQELQSQMPIPMPTGRRVKSQNIIVHEDAIDSDEEDVEEEHQTPRQEPSGPATPYLTRTITTTTTIPLHFSPMTPAGKKAGNLMTPSTVAHAPTTAQSHVLGELSLNQLPFDREAALEQIRLRRGRARSMAAGHGTPRKQMMEGVTERRDISAPVVRVRR